MIDLSDSQNVAVLVLDGELSAADLAEVGEELFRLAHRGALQVVLDFTHVPHLDYRGLRPLAQRAQLLRRAGGDIKLSGLSGYLRKIFRAAGLHDAFECFRDPEDARGAFGRRLLLNVA